MATVDKTRTYRADEDILNDMKKARPRQRVSFNRLAPLTLDGTWQTLPLFSEVDPVKGGSPYNNNSFPSNRYDTVNNLILANPDTDFEQGYLLEIDMVLKPNASGNIIKPMIQFMVPRPANQGGPILFPLPDSAKRVDMGYEITGTDDTAIQFSYPVYTNAAIRAYGAQIRINYTAQKQTANLLTGLLTTVVQLLTGTQRPQITDATLNMYSI